MEKITVGIEKRVSLGVLELALRSVLDSSASSAYFHELANTECSGTNRVQKVVVLLNRMTINNKLIPFIEEHKDEVLQSLRNKNDRALLFASLMCSSYPIFFDIVSTFGKIFHVQEQVNREYLLKKLAEKYGSNRSLEVAYDCIIPMLLEVGFIDKPKKCVYQMIKQEKYSDFAYSIYKQSFMLNNPTFSNSDNIESYPYFEFL